MSRRARLLQWIALGAAAATAAGVAAHLVVSRRVDDAIAAAVPVEGALALESIPRPTEASRAGALSRLWTSTSDAHDAALVDGRLLVATSGGLVEFTGDRAQRELTAWSNPGMADHDVTAVVGRGGRLLLGTRSGLVVLLEGDRARSVRLSDGRLGAVVDLAFYEGAFYVATTSGVVARLDPELRRAASLSPTIDGGATALVAGPSGLFVAGADGIVRRAEGDQLVQVAAPGEGDRSRRLTALALRDGELIVGSASSLLRVTEAGRLEVAREDQFVTSLLALADRLVVATFDRGVAVLDADRPASPERRLLPGRRVDRLRLVDGRVVAIGPGLVAVLDADLGGAERLELPSELASNHITALAIDERRRLWVGHFDDGVDLLSSSGERLRHLPGPEEAQLSAVNDLTLDEAAGAMLVATSHGVLEIRDDDFELIDGDDGLIGEAVSTVLIDDDRRYFATSRGLSVALRASGEVRSIYAFHGLPSNRLTALTLHDDELYVGTLGGVAIVNTELHVVERMSAGPGGLQANWAAALIEAPEGVYVGTTAGVDLVAEGAEVRRLELPGRARVTVNPGAMLRLDGVILVGTQEHGLLIFHRDRAEWVDFEQPLPGASITALAADDGALYLGTTRGLLRLDREALDR